MKTLINLIGIILVVFGIATLAYNGFTYKSRSNLLEVGNVAVTAETKEHIYLSPVTSIVVLAVGIILLTINRRGS